MKKALFIDRDGTIIVEPEDEQIDSFEKLQFLPGCISALSKIAREMDYDLVMVTNQDGLGTTSFPEATFWPVQNLILNILRTEGIEFSEVCIDRSFPHENLPTRKPGTAMLTRFLDGTCDLKESYVIGDRVTDIELAKNLGSKSIFIHTEPHDDATFTTDNWNDIYLRLKSQPRYVTRSRKTQETSVLVTLNLDGSGHSRISTGLGFFDHMLEQVARHGGFDLSIQVTGDLHIDQHHTIEDVALTLGSAFAEALGNKKGIARYGFLLPMDDCLAQVAIDFGGRPWLVWDAEFKREMIGEMPTEMFMHFFKSFSDTAQCNLNIKAEGINEHHKIESIFKAFARALKMAVAKTEDATIPSTKGIL